jgi:hypothetical protein
MRITTVAMNDVEIMKREVWKAADLNDEFKGIWWNHLFDDGDCTAEQIDKIVHTTRATMDFTALPRKDIQHEYSAAWGRDFGAYKSAQLSGGESLQAASDAMCKYKPFELSLC